MYKIESITYLDGTERHDGRYPLRKGCIGNVFELVKEHPLWLEYLQDNKGNLKSGYLRTSLVDDFDQQGDKLTVWTENSIYRFIKVS